MTDTQTNLPFLIVRLFILNPVMHFSTQPMTGEMKCPTSHTFACAFHFIFSNVDATQAPTSIKPLIIIMSQYLSWPSLNDTIHFILSCDFFFEPIIWPYWLIDLNFTCSSPLLWSIGVKSLLKPPRHMWFVASKPPTCPSYLQPVHRCKVLSWSSPSSHTTPCHVSYAMSFFITLYEYSINT